MRLSCNIIVGQWGELGGLIITNFKIHDFPTSEYAFDVMAMGLDWGFNHFTVILLCGWKDGELYICAELAVRGLTEQETVAKAEDMGFPKHLFMWCDSASPALIKAMRGAGFRAQPVQKEPGSVLAQIRWLKDRTIHIHPSCVQTCKEIQAWKWLKDKKSGQYTDEPSPFDDDAMAAMRYVIEGWRKKRRYNTRGEAASE